MKIGTTMYTVKFKNKIPCENEMIFASDLAYYLYYLDVIPNELAEWEIEDIKEKKNKDEKEFTEISKNYSTLFQEYALIRLKANELYERNRVVALTLGILRQKLLQYKEAGRAVPLDLEKAIETVEYFIYRYITKKQDDRLVEQIVFEE
jgi:FtsZ-binding cell division protein ZapB